MTGWQSILAGMDPIGLAEIDACALMNRFDIKYILGRKQLPGVLSHAAESYRVLKIDGVSESSYLTLYFDTADHECYFHHLNRRSTRRKFRIRHYQPSGDHYLEVKEKFCSGRTRKRRVPIEGFQDPLSPELMSFLESAAGRRLQLKPSLWTKFSRVTLAHRDLPERVTIDMDLSFAFDNRREALPDLAIVEVKQQQENWQSPFSVQLLHQRVQPTRFSKYCTGTALLKPHLGRNRLTSKLLEVRKIA